MTHSAGCTIPPVNHDISALSLASENCEILNRDQLTKLHVHLGHAPLSTMTDTINASGRSFGKTTLGDIVRKCGRFCARSRVGHGVANARRSPFPGYAVYFDIVYLKERSRRDYPFLFILDSFPRFIVVCPSKSIRPEYLVSLFYRQWIAYFGAPRFPIRDGGPGAIGRAWWELATVMNIFLICSPTECISKMGTLGRHVGLLKVGISRICSVSEDLSFGEVAGNALIARNHCVLLNSGFPPVQIMFGRIDFSAPLITVQQVRRRARIAQRLVGNNIF